MTGKELRDRLVNEKVVFADLARALNMSPQALNSKLNAKRLGVEFVDDVNSFVYSEGIKPEEPKENDLNRLKNEVMLLKLLEARSQELIDQLKEKVRTQQAIIDGLTKVKVKNG